MTGDGRFDSSRRVSPTATTTRTRKSARRRQAPPTTSWPSQGGLVIKARVLSEEGAVNTQFESPHSAARQVAKSHARPLRLDEHGGLVRAPSSQLARRARDGRSARSRITHITPTFSRWSNRDFTEALVMGASERRRARSIPAPSNEEFFGPTSAGQSRLPNRWLREGTWRAPATRAASQAHVTAANPEPKAGLTRDEVALQGPPVRARSTRAARPLRSGSAIGDGVGRARHRWTTSKPSSRSGLSTCKPASAPS